MKAYVINQDQLKQYIGLAVGALVLSFILGFVVGGMGAEPDKSSVVDTAVELVESENVSSAVLSEAEATNKDNSAAPSKKPDEKTEVKKANVNDKKTTQNKPVEKPAPITIAKVKNQPARTEAPKEIKPVIIKPVVVKPVVVEPAVEVQAVLPSRNIAADNSVEDAPIDVLTMPNELLLPTNNSLGEKRVYSIQAGMFASKTNALSFIEKLAVEKFDAYVTDFVSTSGAVKYNVRVGRFEERDKAREKLQDFQKYFSTPAYVVISQ